MSIIKGDTNVMSGERSRSNYYVFRVFNEDYSFDKYDDNIYNTSEAQIAKDPIGFSKKLKAEIKVYSGTSEDLTAAWQALADMYMGYTYCMKEVFLYTPESGKEDVEHIFCGGILDPDDIDILEEHLTEDRGLSGFDDPTEINRVLARV